MEGNNIENISLGNKINIQMCDHTVKAISGHVKLYRFVRGKKDIKDFFCCEGSETFRRQRLWVPPPIYSQCLSWMNNALMVKRRKSLGFWFEDCVTLEPRTSGECENLVRLRGEKGMEAKETLHFARCATTGEMIWRGWTLYVWIKLDVSLHLKAAIPGETLCRVDKLIPS